MDHEYACISNAQEIRVFNDDSVQRKGVKLLECSKHGQLEAVRRLLIEGAPFLSDTFGLSPMHWSVKNHHHAVTELLLKGGIPRDARNKVDRTPLHVAAELGDFVSAQLLLEYGAEVNVQDILKMTPLHWATHCGNCKTARILLDYGADLAVSNKFDKTPRDIALYKKNFEVLDLIEEFRTMDAGMRTKKAEILKKQLKPAVLLSCDTQNAGESHPLSSGVDQSNKPRKRKFSELEEESKSGEDDILEKVSESALQLLKSHGINLLESLHDSTLQNAVDRGQRLVLTEGGKLALSAFDKLFPGRNLPPPPCNDDEDASAEAHSRSKDEQEAEMKAKEALRAKKENLRRQISFQKSQSQLLKSKLKVVENRLKALEDELYSLEN